MQYRTNKCYSQLSRILINNPKKNKFIDNLNNNSMNNFCKEINIKPQTKIK